MSTKSSPSKKKTKAAPKKALKTASKKATSKKAVSTKVSRAKNKPSKSLSTPQELLSYYEKMLLIRRFEEKAGQLYGMGLIGGFCHLYIGQEAVVVGIQSALIEGDTILTSYRDHGHMIAVGMELEGVMAELTGRSGGYSKGKGGSMHMFSRDKGFYGGHGIVGAQVPIGAGLAFAHKYKANGNIAVTYFGDGASNQGQVYETYNMAKLWDLPVLFIVENNKYGMGTSIDRASSTTDFAKKGEPFGIPGEQVDGMDVSAVKESSLRAVAHIRSGKGPYILEMMTYRYRGHSMSDPAKYRAKEELKKYKEEKDPILNLKGALIKAKIITEDDLKALDKEIKAKVAQAAIFAQESPEPAASELYTDVYVS